MGPRSLTEKGLRCGSCSEDPNRTICGFSSSNAKSFLSVSCVRSFGQQKNQSFGSLQSAYIRLYDEQTNAEILRFQGLGSKRDICVAAVYPVVGFWGLRRTPQPSTSFAILPVTFKWRYCFRQIFRHWDPTVSKIW